MSLRYEQYRALKKTRQFMRDIRHPSTRPKTVKEMNARIDSCTRHFPILNEFGVPWFSRDDFTTEDGDMKRG